MLKDHALESAALVERIMKTLLGQISARGRPGSDARTAMWDLIAHAEVLCWNDEIGPPLDECFELARLTGMSIFQMEYVRTTIVAEDPKLLGAVLVKNAAVNLCLAQEAIMLSEMRFASRQNVEAMKLLMNIAFNQSEEVAADEMAQMTYQKLISSHAAAVFFLTEKARPLPRLVTFRFSAVMPSLVMSHKLYDTADRADELRIENKIVHPAFMRRQGIALSA